MIPPRDEDAPLAGATNASPGTRSQRNSWLDICRALAILLVLLSHGRGFLDLGGEWSAYLRFGGFMGVELFFALSGFLIGGILIRLAAAGGEHWLRGFYMRRWFRTLPNYYLFLGINVLLVFLAVRPGDLSDIPKYLFFVQSLYFPHPVFFSEAWSLAVEEVFYLFFPLLFILLGRIFRISHHHAILLSAALVLAVSLLLRVWVASDVVSWDEEVRKVTLMRFDAIMTGVLLAWLHYRRHPWLAWWGMPWLAAALFVASAVYFAVTPDAVQNESFFAKTYYFTIVAVGCAAVVISGIEWRPPRVLCGIGGFVARISYAAYLVNIPVAMLLVFATRDAGVFHLPPLAMWTMFMALTILISYAVYRWYERFFYALRDKRFPA